MMKKWILPLCVLLMTACNSSSDETVGVNDTTATTTAPSAPAQTVVELDAQVSSVTWERHKQHKNLQTSFKIGGSSVNLDIGDANITTEGQIGVKQGQWTMENGNVISGKVELDLTEVMSLQVDDDQKLQFTSPDYLDIENYPNAVISFGEVPFPVERHNMPVSVTLKGKTQEVMALVNTSMENGEPFLMMVNFSVDGLQWGLVPEDKQSEVASDSLVFMCGFQTGPPAL